MEPPLLTKARICLRSWRDADLEPFRALNADPDVMAFFREPLTAKLRLRQWSSAESDQQDERVKIASRDHSAQFPKPTREDLQ